MSSGLLGPPENRASTLYNKALFPGFSLSPVCLLRFPHHFCFLGSSPTFDHLLSCPCHMGLFWEAQAGKDFESY